MSLPEFHALNAEEDYLAVTLAGTGAGMRVLLLAGEANTPVPTAIHLDRDQAAELYEALGRMLPHLAPNREKPGGAETCRTVQPNQGVCGKPASHLAYIHRDQPAIPCCESCAIWWRDTLPGTTLAPAPEKP